MLHENDAYRNLPNYGAGLYAAILPGLPGNSIDKIQGYFKDLFAISKDIQTGLNSFENAV